MGRATRRVAACAAAVLLAGGLQSSLAHAATTTPRIDLTVLVISDGGPATAAIAAELKSQGTPYKLVDLNDAGRPLIDTAFLSDTLNGQPRGKYQGIVLPNDNPFTAGSAETAAIAAYEAAFGVRQVDAYTYARPDVGLNWAVNPGYMGTLDGFQGQVTASGLGGSFGYLKGTIPFEDNDPAISESYGYLSTPRTDLPAGSTFTPWSRCRYPAAPPRARWSASTPTTAARNWSSPSSTTSTSSSTGCWPGASSTGSPRASTSATTATTSRPTSTTSSWPTTAGTRC